jgi:hypothetical protein
VLALVATELANGQEAKHGPPHIFQKPPVSLYYTDKSCPPALQLALINGTER